MKDREIFSQSVGSRKSVIFLDVRETTAGKRYVKVTQRNKEKGSRNTSDYMYVDMEDFPQFYESLKSVEAGKHAEELLLSGEGFHMAWFERDVRVSKHRLDGKNSVIIFSSRELRSILQIFEKIQEMRVDTNIITLTRREAAAIQGTRGKTSKEIETTHNVRIRITGKKEDSSREVFISGSETDAEEAKKTINEILTFEPLIVTREEAGILLGADGGHVHILDIERQSDTVIEVEKRGYGPPPRCRIYGRQKAKAKAVDLIKDVLLLNQSKVDSCNSVE